MLAMPGHADMFAMFTMGRPDCLPVGDLGVQKGFAIHFGLKVRVLLSLLLTCTPLSNLFQATLSKIAL